MISVLVVLAPMAILFSFIYLCELSAFIGSLKRRSPSLWVELGSPALGRASRSVAIPLMLGKFPREKLDADQCRQATRLRFYLIGLSIFYAVWIVLIAFRRQLTWLM